MRYQNKTMKGLKGIPNVQIGDLVEMRCALSKIHRYQGMGLITDVKPFTCNIDWIILPWLGVDQLKEIQKDLLRQIK
tara:strand:+ start:379 stop:609 length:231 start_codon:yes stop_codon:yes gene_type:complete